jgi:sucrose-6F-phosphate phosphohydrolase
MPERLLLCTDLDRTLIPNGPQPESPAARAHFATLAADQRVVLAYVTGRHRQLVEHAIEEYQLPAPDFVIGDVGTTIYHLESGLNWVPEKAWERQISRDWNGATQHDLLHTLADITALHPQEASKQNTYKLSYYVALDCDRVALEQAINERLQALGVRARQVWSVDDPAAQGLLDILPARASKYHAIAMLQALQGFTDDDTIFSGDSGNDIEVLASSIPAIMVANTEPAVQKEALRQATASHHSKNLYLATGEFNGMNGNYSAGILEGIVHYHAGLAAWMGLGAAS